MPIDLVGILNLFVLCKFVKSKPPNHCQNHKNQLKGKMAKKRKRVLLSWSGGKDSAVVLFELKSPEFEIVGLLTTLEEPRLFVQSHQIPFELIEEQSRSCDLNLYAVKIPENATNEQYESIMLAELSVLKEKLDLDAIAFGNASLENVKSYREELLKKVGLKAIFPLWGWEHELINQAFFGLGHQGIVHSIEKSKLPPAFLGRSFSSSFIEDLPKGVDIAGENGEFHVFVFDGPFFEFKVPFQNRGRHENDRFSFLDLSLNETATSGHNRFN